MAGKEAGGGVVLLGAALAALILANSAFAAGYFRLLNVAVGGVNLLQAIDDGLMALFFLFVGLEIKRELVGGELSDWKRRLLPGIAAAGGIVVPALTYRAINAGPGGAPAGWAIPSATDIAFALGIASLFGGRVPASLRALLTALAIVDDLVAILVIALFYTRHIALLPLALAGVAFAALLALNRFGVARLTPYLLLGVALWGCILESGVHPTLAGVAVAFAVPLTPASESGAAPLIRLERWLRPWIAFLVVPLFGFANAGVALGGVTLDSVLAPVPLGIAAGLFLGKQAGVLGASWVAIRLGLAKLPAGAGWGAFYGVSLLCGVGFTMSLFIGLLAFPTAAAQDSVKIGVLAGSTLSAVAGSIVLGLCRSRRRGGEGD
jgi:NhaA family Na+:H+ antiporter